MAPKLQWKGHCCRNGYKTAVRIKLVHPLMRGLLEGPAVDMYVFLEGCHEDNRPPLYQCTRTSLARFISLSHAYSRIWNQNHCACVV
eukprot:2731415-Amphidinium_carterae.3